MARSSAFAASALATALEQAHQRDAAPDGELVGPLAKEDVVGTYEKRISNGILRHVFLKNSVLESYENGEKLKIEAKWKIVDRELHVELKEGGIIIYRINKDGSITYFSRIDSEGKRTVLSKENQPTYKKNTAEYQSYLPSTVNK